MYEYSCTVVRVVDGDTLHLDVDLGCDVHTLMTIRLAGLDAPEISTEAGKDARDYVEAWVASFGVAPLVLRTVKDRREKYGRYLGALYGPSGTELSLNAELLANGLAVPYSGGARTPG